MRKILVDLFGTAIPERSAAARAKLEAFVELTKYGVDPDSFWRVYAEVRPDLNLDKWGYAEYLEVIGTNLGISFPSIEGFIDADFNSLSTPDDAVVAWLIELTDEVEVGILSDLPAAHLAPMWEANSWISKFAPRLFSGTMGVSAPDPRAFELASQILEAEPEDLLFVSANTTKLEAARAAGYAVAAFANFDQVRGEVEEFLAGDSSIEDSAAMDEN